MAYTINYYRFNVVIFLGLLSLLSACGFYRSTALVSINAEVVAEQQHLFAKVLRQNLNSKQTPSLRIELSSERRQKSVATYSKGSASGHYLTLSIPVKVFKDKRLLFSQTLTQSSYLADSPTTLASKRQQEIQYHYLREAMAKRFVGQLNLL